MKNIYEIVTLCLTLGLAAAADTWSYSGSDGPDEWASNFEKCGDESQSPIDIIPSDVTVKESLGEFNRSDFTQLPSSMTLKNNGHAVQVDVTGGPTITDRSILPEDFSLAQFHLHWAAASNQGGSEHTVDGTQYFGEFHAVFYNTNYMTLSNAVPRSDGLAVLGFFIDTANPQDNDAFNRIFDKLGNVTNQNDTYSFDTSEFMSLEEFFPSNISHYYRYSGSLTTPTCDESVTWTVFKTPIQISVAQATRLATSLKVGGSSSSLLVDNYRPVQPLNGRTIFENSATAAGSKFITFVVAFTLTNYLVVC